MSVVKLTDKTIQSLRTEKNVEQFFDQGFTQGSFGIQVTRGGKKTFFLRYRRNNKKKWLTLGVYGRAPFTTLKDARDEALTALAKIRDGADPAAEQKAYQASDTFKELAEEFLQKRGRDKNWPETTRKDFESMLRRDLYPRWQDAKAEDIRKRDVIDVLEDIAYVRGSVYMANRTKELIHAIFNWAVKRDVLENNPAAGVDDFLGEKPRDRYLSSEEIKALWDITEEKVSPLGRAFYQLLLIWGMRPGEVMKLKWSYFDGDTVLLPAEITKNRRSHGLHVPDLVWDEINVLREKAQNSEYLFPGFRAGDYRRSFKTDHKILLTEMEGEHWQNRDLRRTVETQMTRSGIDRAVVDKVLNHGDSGMTARHYDWHDYYPEKKKALLKWEQVLRGIIGENDSMSAKVIAFPV